MFLRVSSPILAPFLLLGSFSLVLNLSATPVEVPGCVPNCRDLNVSLNIEGQIQFTLRDLLVNEQACNRGVISVLTRNQHHLLGPINVDIDDLVSTDACEYLGQVLKVKVQTDKGVCTSELTIKSQNVPVISGESHDTWCFDSIVSSPNAYVKYIGGKQAKVACQLEPIPAHFVSDWVDFPMEDTCGNDTLKIIYREFEAFDKSGVRGVVVDTIVVFRPPKIHNESVFCLERSEIYCSDPQSFQSPILVLGNSSLGSFEFQLVKAINVAGELQFVAAEFGDKCGLQVNVDHWRLTDDCEQLHKVVVDLKQSCYGSPSNIFLTPGATLNVGGPPIPPNVWVPLSSDYTYWRCEFWVTNIDTLPPTVLCKAKADPSLAIVSTANDRCVAETNLPDVWVVDDWSGVKQVKATVLGIGSFVFQYNELEGCFSSLNQVELPENEAGYQVIYEAYDSCHNLGTDTCYLYVKDRVDPVAVVNGGLSVTLNGKKSWVTAESFNEGSRDNCEINRVLVRRVDWYDACVDLQDSVEYCYQSSKNDTVWQAILSSNKHQNEVEAHYSNTLRWLREDDSPCSEVLYNAWTYDLLRLTSQKQSNASHSSERFNEIIKEGLLSKDDDFGSKFKCANALSSLKAGDILFVGSDDGESDANGDTGGDGTSDNAFYAINVDDGFALPIPAISGMAVRGLAADERYDRLLFTASVPGLNNDGALLFSWDIDGKTAVRKLGYITYDGHLVDAQGLGFLGGKLYAYIDDIWGTPFDQDGIYEIDLQSLEAHLVLSTEGTIYEEITALDGDVETGKLYGADDVERDIIEIDLEMGVITKLADYPGVAGSLEGMGIGAGNLYMIDDDGDDDIFVFDIATQTFEEPIANPFTAGDDEAGAAALFSRGICGYSSTQLSTKIDEWSQLGGGWSDAVVFSCEDACGPVTVEILVMDYWCNWAKAWTNVWVEDKTPVQVVKDVIDEETITCKTYKDARYDYPGQTHPVSLDYVVEQAKAGEEDAYDLLDEVFGGYCKAWKDPYGNYVDIEGNEIECDIPFYDSVCQCTSYTDKVRVYDEHHGFIWKDSLITKCDYYQDTIDFQKGIVLVNCEENVYCEQEVWCEFDHCGQGYIFRKFKIWQSCPDSFYLDHNVPDSLKHPVDTIYRHQRIWVGNECPLSKYMFDVPEDTEVNTCGLEYDASGNLIGAAGPESTGYATYRFDDDCRLVGIGHSDKVFKIVGGDAACYKILRTWYFADWCGYGGEPLEAQWWFERELVIDSCVQKIIVIDTMPPVCVITGPVESGGSIEVGACAYNLEVTVSAIDSCGIDRYYWELLDISDSTATVVVDDGSGSLGGSGDESFDISSEDLDHGTYKLKVVTVDNCNNEGYCEYVVDVVSVKKPSPVCVTSLTARLTPWDSDQDGEVDSAHAVVWAGEFDRSSAPACQDTAIEFRIEFIKGDSTDNDAAGDADSLSLGCSDIGTHGVRLWVVSLPSDSRDYCDVVLIVQSDGDGCGTSEVGEREPLREVSGMTEESGAMDRGMLSTDGGKKATGIGGRPLDGRTLLPGQGYGLEQNRPNPFAEETSIGFVLPSSMEATITVYDVTGRIIRSIEGDFQKGYNQVQFRKTDLGVSGILYYRLNAGVFAKTRKMVLID